MSTQRGIPCPACDGKEQTEYVALQPLVQGEGTIAPHEYAVGRACYKKQWAEVYPAEPCPVK